MRGAARERHDRQHRVGPGGAREGARVADPDARRVVQLAPRVGDRGLRVARPSGSCPSGGRRRAGSRAARSGCALSVGDERLEVVAAAPVAAPCGALPTISRRAGRLVDADQLLDRRRGCRGCRARWRPGTGRPALPSASITTRPWPRSRSRLISGAACAQSAHPPLVVARPSATARRPRTGRWSTAPPRSGSRGRRRGRRTRARAPPAAGPSTSSGARRRRR